jgi:hypothetical protein
MWTTLTLGTSTSKGILARETYGNARMAEPEIVGDTKILHVVDPCGVFLIFIQ